MNSITLRSARYRLQTALDLLELCDGIATDPGPSLEDQLRVLWPINRSLLDYHPDLPDDHIVRLHTDPSMCTVRHVIERAAQEARHAAQEALDEIAHADGWPR